MRHVSLWYPKIKDNLPKEDFMLISKKYPIFAVADGVTLIQFLIENKKYPNPSPSGEVSKILCKNLIKSAEEKYENFSNSDIQKIFLTSNKSIKKYNEKHGRSKKTINYWGNDFYAATAAFAIIKKNKVYWGSICDSYIVHMNSDGKILFKSPHCHAKKETEGPMFTGDLNNKKERIKYAWSTKRNAMNDKRKLTGYGVATGEENASHYLNTGILTLKKGEFLLIFTDGFESYIDQPEFILLLKKRLNTEIGLKKFIRQKSTENPDVFGSEKSVIIVST